MLRNAYGWWKASQIMYIAALTSYALAALALAGSGIALIRRHQITHDTSTAPKAEQLTTA
jgi:hypothetical protein